MYHEIFLQIRYKFSDILVCQKTALNNVDESQLRKLTSNDKDAAETSEKDQPKSLVMVYEGSSDKDFKHFSIGVSSKFVMSKLIQKNAVFMWNQMVSLSVEHGGYGWKIFESYCQEILLGEPKEYSFCKYHNGTDLVPLGKKHKTWWVQCNQRDPRKSHYCSNRHCSDQQK